MKVTQDGLPLPVEPTREIIHIKHHEKLLPGDEISFIYTNWKGRKARRFCIFNCMVIGRSQMTDNLEYDIFINGMDKDKSLIRSYHISGIEQGSVELISRKEDS